MLRLLVFLAVSLVVIGSSVAQVETPGKNRHFRFHYGATIGGLVPGDTIRVWIPIPPNNSDQSVRAVSQSVPGDFLVNQETKHGNQIGFFESRINDDGSISFQTVYEVDRKEVMGLTDGREFESITDDQRELYLSANSRVPTTGKPTALLQQLTLPVDPVAMAKVLYYRVDDHVKYDKSRPGYGDGDVLWVCDSGFGNCTDFHSLFISFARSKQIPAKFEIGFPLPPERGNGTLGGYHCWAMFYSPLHGWIPVDISEADKHPEMKEYYFGNLTENRVVFSTGRDIELVPKQAGPPLNYFVYPYAEVNGKPVAKELFTLSFAFEDTTVTK